MKRDYKKFFIIMICIVTISSIGALITPILVNTWAKEFEILGYKEILLIISILAISLCTKIGLIILREKFAKNFNIGNFKNMLTKYFKLNYDEIIDQGPVNLLERIIMATNSIYTYMTGDSIYIWSSIIIILITLIMTAKKSILIFTIMLLAIPINYFGFKYINKRLQEKSKSMQIATATGWQKILSIVKHTDYLKQFTDYSNFDKIIDPILNDVYKSMADVNIFGQSGSNIIRALNEMFKTIIIILTISSFSHDNKFYATLIFMTLIVPLYFENINIITNSNLNKRDFNIAMELMGEWDKKSEKNGNQNLDEIHTIMFDIKNLKLKNTVLSNNICGEFRKGDIVWVKGNSGVGKSTLIKSILKYREQENIFINDIDIKDINNELLRSKIIYLSQDTPIINGSLKDNLFLNKEYDIDIANLFRKEKLLESIFKNRDLDSEILDNGANLSGGEKQKIAIARILYDKPEILILDEITSNIDDEDSKAIYSRLIEDNYNKIIFIISHDEISSKYFNREIYLEKSVNNESL